MAKAPSLIPTSINILQGRKLKSEYLITFDSKDGICTTVEKFKKLLSVHELISFPKKEKIAYKGKEYSYQLAQGTLTDNSIYYDLTLECNDIADQDAYKDLLREIRIICAKTSGRNIITLHDGVGEEYCHQGYPTIYKTENLMRKLIAKFMAISIGYDWSEASTPKEVLDSVRIDGKREKTNFLHEVDFIQLSNFLFKKYTKSDANRFFDSIKEKDDADQVTAKDLKQYAPFTNWEKYFARKVQCDSEYLKTKWERLYEYRCKIAHCKGITKLELDDLKLISGDICAKIQAALDSIGDLHIEDTDREELAENFSGAANKNAAEFIQKYNKLAALVRIACDLSSDENDIYSKHETNKTNIQMQSKYLWNAKGVISKETADLINRAQTFRNKVVHQVGIVEVSDSELLEEMHLIDSLIEHLALLDSGDLSSKRGLDLRNQQGRD